MSANSQFYTLKIKEVKRETDQCVTVTLDIPKEYRELFSYQSGQYLTFKKEIDSEDIRRSYSLCTAPHENEMSVAIKKVKGGVFSTFANKNLHAGETLDAMPPQGSFICKSQNDEDKHYMAFAAGSGITPIISIIKSVLHNTNKSTFTLVYGNQNFYSIIFREEIEALKNKYMGRFQVTYILSRERMESDINYGRIDETKCKQLFEKLYQPSFYDDYYMCGPEQMLQNVKQFLIANNVKESKIHYELFYTSEGAKNEKKKAFFESHKESIGKKSIVTIKVDDRSMQIPLAFEGESILDAALKHGADLPFACKGGVCCTCKAKVISGTVDMEVNYALEPDEVANGYILTCQAHPTSDEVFIDFDVR